MTVGLPKQKLWRTLPLRPSTFLDLAPYRVSKAFHIRSALKSNMTFVEERL